MPRFNTSYRANEGGPAFDDSDPVYIFDGYCVLCSEGAKWMIRRDPKGKSKILAVPSPLARAIYAHHNLDPDRLDTFLVLKNGIAYSKWRGWLEAAQTMPGPWRWLGYDGHIVPGAIGDLTYAFIQRNRFQWFGKRENDLVLDSAIRAMRQRVCALRLPL